MTVRTVDVSLRPGTVPVELTIRTEVGGQIEVYCADDIWDLVDQVESVRERVLKEVGDE